jgi:4-amino-4-deoxy-L-arabinose transferase-like glycosyltransferase
MQPKYIYSYPKSELVYALALGLVGLLAFWILLQSTPFGLGLVNDSAAYIGGADNILAGNGYSRLTGGGEIRPITHFPPLFSILLAGMGLLGVETIPAAHRAILGLFGLNAILVGISVRLVTRSKLFSVLGAALFAVNALFIRVHSFAMSEPLFIFLSLLGLICFAQAFAKKNRAWLVSAGILMGLAAVTRFVGLALILAAAAVLVLFARDWKKALQDMVLFSAGWLPLVAAWLVRNQAAAGSSTNRQIGWHPPTWETAQGGIERFWSWLLPDRVVDLLQNYAFFSNYLLAILILTLLAVLAYAWIQYRHSDPDEAGQACLALWFLHGVYIVIYTAAILATITFLDASTPLENRILAPALASLLILLAVVWHWIWQWKKLYVRIALAVAVFIFSARFISDGRLTIENLQKDGQGYSTRVWRESETMQAIRDLPPDTVIYTNRPTAVYLLTGRGAYVTPSPLDPVQMQQRPEYMNDLSRMKEEVREGRAILIFFAPGQLTQPEEIRWYEEVKSGLTMSYHFEESDVYGPFPAKYQP